MILKGWVRTEKGNAYDKTKKENDTYIYQKEKITNFLHQFNYC